MSNRNFRIKTYPLLINGERIDTGTYRYFLDADEIIKNPPLGFKVNRARTEDDIPGEAKKHLFARWCLGSNVHNVKAIEAAYEASREMKRIPLKVRVEALEAFGKRHIMDEKAFWRALSVQEFHTENAFEEEHHSLEKLFDPESIAFQASLITPRKVPGGSLLTHEPYGVFGTITPSNTSYAMLTNILFAAVLSGNALVIKPPQDAPIVAVEMAERFQSFFADHYGFPKGMFNLIIGDAREIVSEWLSNPKVRGVFYLGSYKHGRAIYDQFSRQHKRVIAETNGNDIFYIHKDVKNLEAIVENLVHARFTASGQFCIGAKRAVVHPEIYDDVVDLILEKSKPYIAGLMRDPKTKLVPVGNICACDAVKDLIREGGKLARGGNRINHLNEKDPNGIFCEATVVADVPLESETILDEIFAPILPVIKADRNMDKTIEVLNRSPYKLKATIHTSDPELIAHFAETVDVGTVNVCSSHFVFNGGFFVGGPGQSSISDTGVRSFPYDMTKAKIVHDPNGAFLPKNPPAWLRPTEETERPSRTFSLRRLFKSRR